MATIVPGLPGSGYYFGQGLGKGLSTGLEELAQHRVQEMHRRQKSKSLLNAGFTQKEADFLIDNPELSDPFIKSLSLSGNASQQENSTADQEGTTGKSAIDTLNNSVGNAPTVATGTEPNQLAAKLSPEQKTLEELKSTNVPQPVAKPAQALNPRQQLAQPSIRDQLAKTSKVTTNGVSESQQKTINASNKHFLDSLQDLTVKADSLKTLATEYINLLDTGKVAEGILGSYTPTVFLNEESQRAQAISNEMALLLASGSGVASTFKIKLAQNIKPNLSQKAKTQRELANDIIKKADKALDLTAIKDQILAENNYNQPAGLETKMRQRLNAESKPKPDEEVKKDNFLAKLPSVSEAKKNLKAGDEIIDHKTNTRYTWTGSGYKKSKGE